MKRSGLDPFDAAIDQAARRIVALPVAPGMARGVLAAVEAPGAAATRARPWRLAFGLASVALSVAVASFVWTRGQQETRATVPRAEAVPPGAASAQDAGPQVLTTTALTEETRPRPVRIATVSVKPVTAAAVEVAPVSVARVEVAPVTMADMP